MGLRIAACIGWLSVVAAPVLMGACSSDVSQGNQPPNMAGGGSSSTGGTGSITTTAGTGPMTQACTEGVALANARLWRLTDAQYVNAVRQVFGVVTGPQVTEADSGAADYTNLSELTVVNDGIVGKYQTSAHDVARQAVKSHYATFMACDSEVCAQQFIRNRIARAFGRRLDDGEVTGYLDLFRKGLTQSPQDGVRLMIEAALQSPSFLYRTELGAPQAGGPTGQVTLTAHEVASLISFSLTNSVPDQQLWDKADTNALLDPAVLSAEVDRLLDLPETKANLADLGGYWLGVQKLRRTEKDLTKFPEFTDELKASLQQSAQLFVQDLLANGKVTDLVTSKRMFLNESLANLYGVPGVTGADIKAVDTTLPERSNGILSQPGMLTAYARTDRGDPIHRGLFSFYALVCGGSIPPPPPGALDIAKGFPPNLSERAYAGLRADNGVCKACHSRFDPLGLVTERYDPIGRYHETDAAGPIDQSSVFATLGPDLDGPVNGLADLSAKLVAGRRLSDCAVQNLSMFTLGHDVIGDTSCALQSVKDTLAQTGKFRDFYKALLTSPAFIKRDVK
jgi:hypothetical protein